jgi:inosine-uridine nucleoside N-ribohydrolase
VQEFNIQVDPEAAKVVFEAGGATAAAAAAAAAAETAAAAGMSDS